MKTYLLFTILLASVCLNVKQSFRKINFAPVYYMKPYYEPTPPQAKLLFSSFQVLGQKGKHQGVVIKCVSFGTANDGALMLSPNYDTADCWDKTKIEGDIQDAKKGKAGQHANF